MRSCSTNALPLLAPIPPPPPDDGAAAILADVFEQADELLEEFVWAKGLIPAGECFEQFGWTESAPALKDVGNHVTEEQRKGLASCLATPFMYDNEHLSKRAQELVMKRGQVMEQQLTNRQAACVTALTQIPCPATLPASAVTTYTAPKGAASYIQALFKLNMPFDTVLSRS